MRKSILTILIVLTSTFAQAQSIDSCNYYKHKCDTLSHNLYIEDEKMQKVLFYTNICIKKPTQIKFLKGWIKRAIK